jgi:hypothetical protein
MRIKEIGRRAGVEASELARTKWLLPDHASANFVGHTVPTYSK